MTKTKLLALGLFGLMLSGCGHGELIGHTMSAREWGDPLVFDALKNQRPVGSPFATALAKLYSEFAVNQKEEGDLRNFEVFARKGLLAAQGVIVDPELPDRWDLDKLNYSNRVRTASYAEAYEMRTRMMNAFWKCTRLRAPEAAAKAQVSYDIWIEELEEGWEGDEIDAAKADFLAALAQVEQSCPPPSKPDSFIIFFDTNKSAIRKTDKPVIDTIAKVVKEANAGGQVKLIHGIGWADTRASTAYNQKLSERRIESAKAALIAAGVNPADITTEARGETRLPKPTKDGVNEIRNRTDHLIVYVKPVPPIPFSPAPQE